jgi:hypothetical protein
LTNEEVWESKGGGRSFGMNPNYFELQIYIQGVEDTLSITQLALELLADICVQDDESEGIYLALLSIF